MVCFRSDEMLIFSVRSCLLSVTRQMVFSVSGVRQPDGVLPDAAAAELGPGPVQHLPLQPISKRASWQGRRTCRSVGLGPD